MDFHLQNIHDCTKVLWQVMHSHLHNITLNIRVIKPYLSMMFLTPRWHSLQKFIWLIDHQIRPLKRKLHVGIIGIKKIFAVTFKFNSNYYSPFLSGLLLLSSSTNLYHTKQKNTCKSLIYIPGSCACIRP